MTIHLLCNTDLENWTILAEVNWQWIEKHRSTDKIIIEHTQTSQRKITPEKLFEIGKWGSKHGCFHWVYKQVTLCMLSKRDDHCTTRTVNEKLFPGFYKTYSHDHCLGLPSSTCQVRDSRTFHLENINPSRSPGTNFCQTVAAKRDPFPGREISHVQQLKKKKKMTQSSGSRRRNKRYNAAWKM